jgi:hypothetical protein
MRSHYGNAHVSKIGWWTEKCKGYTCDVVTIRICQLMGMMYLMALEQRFLVEFPSNQFKPFLGPCLCLLPEGNKSVAHSPSCAG